MKRKIVVATATLSIMLAGVVSAASIWGTYKGNDIIRLTVNGDPVKVSDVPAISYNDRTMIPIYLLKQAGIDYTWDKKNKSVDITPKEVNTETVIDTETVNYLKTLSKISNHYNELYSIGGILYTANQSVQLAYDAVRDDFQAQTQLDNANESLNSAINSYNNYLTSNDNIIKLAAGYGYNINNSNQILNYYYSAIDYLKNQYQNVVDYYSSKNHSYVDLYFSNWKSFSTDLNNGQNLALKQKQYYYNVLINY